MNCPNVETSSRFNLFGLAEHASAAIAKSNGTPPRLWRDEENAAAACVSCNEVRSATSFPLLPVRFCGGTAPWLSRGSPPWAGLELARDSGRDFDFFARALSINFGLRCSV
jgi:hypothetical protein